MSHLVRPSIAVMLLAATALAKEPGPLTTLLDGNRRFVEARETNPHRTPARREEVAKGQHPFAVVVGCADSRVPPEVVFDQGLGDVFVVRTAGEVVDDVGLGSIEFAVAKLGARLIVVLGHESCGAVEAALRGDPVPGHVAAVVNAIKPNLSPASPEAAGALDHAIDEQVRATVEQLRGAAPVLAPMVKDGSLEVVGAVYDLDTGAVRVLPGGPPPQR